MNDEQIARVPLGLACWAAASLLGFLFPFGIGALAGMATPGGWQAWQLGALVAAIVGGIAAVIFFSLALLYVLDG